MARTKASKTVVQQEFPLPEDDKSKVKVQLGLPYYLPVDRVQTVLQDLVEALEIERHTFEETTTGRQHHMEELLRSPSGKARVYAGRPRDDDDDDGEGDER